MLMINGWLGPIGAIGFLYMEKRAYSKTFKSKQKKGS
jgi:hypothetical protein